MSDVTIPRREVIARHGETQEPFRMGERIIRGNTAAGSGSHRMEFFQPKKLYQVMEVSRARSRIVLRSEVGVVIIAPRISDHAIARLGEHRLLV